MQSSGTPKAMPTMPQPSLQITTNTQLANLTPSVSEEDDEPPKYPIYSPFYQHPPASHERFSESRRPSKALSVSEKELESGLVTPRTFTDEDNPFSSKVSVECNKECKMWPSRQTLMQKRMAEKKRKRDTRRCGCGPAQDHWLSYSKKQRLTFKILFALFLVAVVVAIAVGITKAVNGSVYASRGNNHPLSGS